MKIILFAILSYLFYRMFVAPFMSSITGQNTDSHNNIKDSKKPHQNSSNDEYLDYEEVE